MHITSPSVEQAPLDCGDGRGRARVVEAKRRARATVVCKGVLVRTYKAETVVKVGTYGLRKHVDE